MNSTAGKFRQRIDRSSSFLAIILIFSSMAFAQTDTVDVPSDRGQGEGRLNDAVSLAIESGTLSNTIFRLEPHGLYILDSTIVVPVGTRLTITAPDPGNTQETAPPMILWSSNGSISTAYSFDCFGDITLKNLWLFYANTAGEQTSTSLRIRDSQDTINGQHGTFDGVLFDYSQIGAESSGAVSVTSRHFRGTLKNCYFRNCTDRHFRYYGRAVSFPYASTGWHTDSLTFENCTFANMGFVYMQENGNYADMVRFNHCTFLNVMMFPLESGWWRWLSVTNSVFVNTFLYGDEQVPGNSVEPYGGTLAIDSISKFGFSVPFTEPDRHILFTHSSYCLEDWVREYMVENFDTNSVPFSVRPQPMLNPRTLAFFDRAVDGIKSFPYMNRAYLLDSTNPGFTLPPTNHEAIKRYLWMKWFTGGGDTTWAFNPEDDIAGVWPMKENLYYINPVLVTAGMGGFPPGDLYRWFPDKYLQWRAQSVSEYARIDTWLTTGVDPAGPDAVKNVSGSLAPATFELRQNYPNPFNPTTGIRYQVTGDSDVRLAVYDVLGREVAVLVGARQTPGEHEVRFDGSSLSSGIYFYRLTAGLSQITRSMVLLR